MWLLQNIKATHYSPKATDLRRGRGERKNHPPVKHSLKLQQKDEAEASRESPMQFPVPSFISLFNWEYSESEISRFSQWDPDIFFFLLYFAFFNCYFCSGQETVNLVIMDSHNVIKLTEGWSFLCHRKSFHVWRLFVSFDLVWSQSLRNVPLQKPSCFDS